MPPATVPSPAGGERSGLNDNPLVSFNREHRDEAWARPREDYLRLRLERLALLAGGHDPVEVECRASCCRIEFGGRTSWDGEIDTAAGVPSGESGLFASGLRVICYDRTKPLPPPHFVDRLDERIALDPVFRAAENRCASAAGSPGHLAVRIEIAAGGTFDLHLAGDILATPAAACVENYLDEQLRFKPAHHGSHLEVTLRIGSR